MCRRHYNVAERGPPDTILVHYSGSDAAIALVTYIICLHGWVPKMYKLWSMNAQGVREVHPFARVRLFDDFCEDTFWATFFNSQICRIPFIGRRLINRSVQFLCFADVTSDSTKDVISTRNIFVHEWGNYPTMIWPTCSNYTCRAYVPITQRYKKGKITQGKTTMKLEAMARTTSTAIIKSKMILKEEVKEKKGENFETPNHATIQTYTLRQ